MELQNIPSMTKLLNSSEFSDFDINQEILKKIINNTLDSVRKTVNSKKNNNLTDEDIRHQILVEMKLPILGKVENDNLVIDLRTIFNEYDNYLIESLNNFFKK